MVRSVGVVGRFESPLIPVQCGSVAEWFKALVLKTSDGGTHP